MKEKIITFLSNIKEKSKTQLAVPRRRLIAGVIVFFLILISLRGCYTPPYIQGYVDYLPLYMASRAEGQLEVLMVKKGMWVEQGTLLFSLDPSPEADQVIEVQAQLQQAEATLADAEKGSRETILEGLRAAVESAKAAVALAEITQGRYTRLYAVGAVEKATLDAAVTDTDVKVAQLEEAQAQLAEAELGQREDFIRAQADNVANYRARLKEAQWALDQKTLYAPVKVLVLDTYYQPGEYIISGRPVVSLLDPTKVYAVIYLAAPILSDVKVGDIFHVAHDKSRKKYPATVTFISDTAEFTPPVIYSRENNQQLVFRVEVTFSPDIASEFHPGQPVNVYM